jgi:hypothetical protein
MCIAKVPVAVSETSSQNGARPRLAKGGAESQFSFPAALSQTLRLRIAAGALPLRKFSNRYNA